MITKGNFTFGMIKPDATRKTFAKVVRKEIGPPRFGDKHLVHSEHNGSFMGQVIHMIENRGFNIVGLKMVLLTQDIAEGFYEVHKDKGFFKEMIAEMLSGPVVVMALYKKHDAVSSFRDLIGSTNPQEAKEGTIRHAFGVDIGRNSVHGSDSDENAIREINFFFGSYELMDSTDDLE